MTLSLENLVSDELGVTLYGQLITGVEVQNFSKSKLMAKAGFEGPLAFALILGKRIGRTCMPTPPHLVLVPGKGAELSEGDCRFPGADQKWLYLQGEKIVALELTTLAVGDLQGPSSRGVGGGISFSDWRLEGGSLKFTVHYWAKITVHLPWGDKTILDVSGQVPVSISLGQCLTVLSAGGLELDVCYEPPKQVCAELKYNIPVVGSGTIVKQCINVPV